MTTNQYFSREHRAERLTAARLVEECLDGNDYVRGQIEAVTAESANSV